MTLLRIALSYLRPAPLPSVGQLWVSGHSGNAIRIEKVATTDTGGIEVRVSQEGNHRWRHLHYIYAKSAREWRRKVRQEARYLDPCVRRDNQFLSGCGRRGEHGDR